MGIWKTLAPPDQPYITLSAPDNNYLTFEGSAFGYLSSYNYNDTYPIQLMAGYSYDFITVNNGSGFGSRGSGLYGVWTDIIIYNDNGDLIAINRALSDGSQGYNGDVFDFTPSVSGIYYISESMYFTWDSGYYYLAINVDAPSTPTIPATPATTTVTSNSTVNLTDANDTLAASSGNEVIYCKSGNDTVRGSDGDDTLYGGNDQDLLFGNVGNDLLFGNTGLDMVFGGRGDDSLFGGLQDDTIFGDEGNDHLQGDSGADLFVFGAGSGADVIHDFNATAGDRIGIQGSIQYQLSSNAAGNAVITFSASDTITLDGVRLDQVQASWFAAV